MYNDYLAFFGFLIVLWLLSPIALMIAYAHLSKANEKLSKEVERLRAELRSRDGAASAVSVVESETTGNAASAGEMPLAGTVAAVSPTPDLDESRSGRPEGVAVATGDRPDKSAASRGKRINPLNAVFVVGALFIVTAGVIFASSTWQELGTVPRIAVLGMVAAFFFIASGIARARFDLRSTGAAFFALGSVYLPVACVASGLLGLLGEPFTASGDRVFLLWAGAAFLLAASTLRGSLLYRSRVFAWVSLSSVTCLVSFLAASFNRGVPTTALVLAVYSAVLVVPLEAIGRLGNGLHKPKAIDPLAARLRATPFARAWRPYAALNVIAATAVSFSDLGGERAGGATLAILAVLFLSRTFNDSRGRLSGIGVYPFALCLALWITRLPGAEPVPSIALASALVMTLGLSGVVPERTRKASSIASLLAIAWGAAEAMARQDGWSVQLVGALAILSVAVGFRARSGDRAFKALHPLLVVVLAFGCAEFFGGSAPAAYAIAGAVLLASLVAYGPLGLGSRVSDAVFLVALLLDFLFLRDRASVPGEIALFLANLAAILWVARREPLARYAVPHYALLGFLATGDFFARDRYAAVFWYALVVAAGSAERILRKIARVPEAARSFAIAISSWGAIGVLAGISGSDLSAYHAIPWLALAYWLVSYAAPEGRRPFDIRVAGALFLAGPLFSALAFTESRAIAPQWAFFAPALAALALAFAESDPRIARDQALRKACFALSAGAIQIIAIACSIAYLYGKWLPLSYGVAALALTAVAYAVARAKGASALGVLPLALVYAYARRASPDLLPLISSVSSIGDSALLENLLYCAFFSVSVTLSMTLHRALCERRGDGRVCVDAFALIAPIAPIALAVSGVNGLVANGEYWTFAGLALLAVAALLFWQRTGDPRVDRAALTSSLAFLAAAIVVEPFFAVPGIVLDEWRLLVPLAALVVIRRFVWRDNERILGWVAFAWGCACIAILSWQALARGEGTDAIILGTGALGVFVASFILRLKRIFVLSTITLVALGIYLSREFWLDLAWWIYLLSAGVALISFAVVNENMRKRGSGIASKAGRVFAEWRW